MPSPHNYSEDLFADTRMTFGEHIEELRSHLISAIKGLVFCMTIGFVLDSIGRALDFSQANLPWVVNAYVLTFGIGFNGMVKANFAPPPGRFSAQIFPPCF